eukprot:TRINITY_DN10240_c0_g1_i1.p1 TRINITY_DN10240_c0_g1~~TRINITY_DN10240_c0_g1_i1.p1  ORF type:complete len:169 (-),score=36.33 TRINITY_DN10240_c0_g1_i1:212-718(-)
MDSIYTGDLINKAPVVITPPASRPSAPLYRSLDDYSRIDQYDVYDTIRSIRDPEHPYTLQQLGVVTDESVVVVYDGASDNEPALIRVTFKPTVPQCSLATMIGLCIYAKMKQHIDLPFKLELAVAAGSHNTGDDVNRQINDKERLIAALDNPLIAETVSRLIKERDES